MIINSFKMLFNLLLKMFKKETSVKGSIIKREKLLKMFKKEYRNAYIVLNDKRFYVPITGEFTAWMKEDLTNMKIYRPEVFDCENFAYEFFVESHRKIAGNVTIGVIQNNEPAHAYNIVITRNKKGALKMTEIEPQTDMKRDFPNDSVYLIIM